MHRAAFNYVCADVQTFAPVGQRFNIQNFIRQLLNRAAPFLRCVAYMRPAPEGFHRKAVAALATQHQAVVHKAGFKVKRSNRAFGFRHSGFAKIAVLMPNFLVARKDNLNGVLIIVYAFKRLQGVDGNGYAGLHIKHARSVSTAVFNGKGASFGFSRVAEHRVQMPYKNYKRLISAVAKLAHQRIACIFMFNNAGFAAHAFQNAGNLCHNGINARLIAGTAVHHNKFFPHFHHAVTMFINIAKSLFFHIQDCSPPVSRKCPLN